MMFKLFSSRPAVAAAPTVRQPLPVRVCGHAICCSVGHTTAAAIAAINARVNHFRETDFIDAEGQPVIGGSLFEVEAWGAERLHLMLDAVIDQCCAGLNEQDLAQTALVLLVPEPTRPGMPRDELIRLTGIAVESRGLHAKSRAFAYGKGGIALCVEEAAALLQGKDAPHRIVLAAVDSLLDAGVIEDLIDAERLLTRSCADGLIPGEAAAAVLLSAQPERDGEDGFWIDGAGHSLDDWRVGGETPARAQGLTQAIRRATSQAGVAVIDLDAHASGMTGESWYSKEVGLALSRCMEGKKTEFPHLMVAPCTGETGAAGPLLTLAWLNDLTQRPGPQAPRFALLHFAGDDGQRSALVVRRRSSKT